MWVLFSKHSFSDWIWPQWGFRRFHFSNFLVHDDHRTHLAVIYWEKKNEEFFFNPKVVKYVTLVNLLTDNLLWKCIFLVWHWLISQIWIKPIGNYSVMWLKGTPPCQTGWNHIFWKELLFITFSFSILLYLSCMIQTVLKIPVWTEYQTWTQFVWLIIKYKYLWMYAIYKHSK